MIEEVYLYEVCMRLKTPFETSFGRTIERPAILVRLVGDGVEGWGEVVAGEGPWYSYETYITAMHILKDYLVPLLLKNGIEDPHTFIERASSIRGHNMAKAGLEHALWDLEARRRKTPLWRLLGGTNKHVQSGVSIGIKGTVQELIDTVQGYLEQGYKRIKIKIKHGWDIEPVKALRRELGEDLPLQVDANAAYTLEDLGTLKKLDEYDLTMIEQPLHYEDLLDHSTLARLLRTPICLDESITSLKRAIEAYKLDSAHIINLKPGRVGGHTVSLKIHEFWTKSAGRPLWIGGMLETGIGRGHLVALATLPGVKYPNDISGSDRYYEEDIVDPVWIVRNGVIEAPERPGIGVEPRIDLIEKLSKRIIRMTA